MTPRVSIVVPTRNRRAGLARALDSVAGQGFRDYEVIVVNDASDDDTAAWLRDHNHECRVVTLDKRAGAAAARNRGVAESRGEFVAFLDDDDAWRPTYLDAQVRSLDANPAAALSFTGHLEIDGASGRTAAPDTAPLLDYPTTLVRLCAEGFIHTMSVVVCRRELFARVGALDERLAVVHDLEWYCRVLQGGQRFVHLPDVLVARSVPGGLVTRYRAWFQEEQAVLSRVLGGDPDEALVRTCRSLFFARLALAQGDLAFGFRRLGEASLASPRWAISIAARRLARRVRRRAQGALPGWATAS